MKSKQRADRLVSDRLIIMVLKALLQQFERKVKENAHQRSKPSTAPVDRQLGLWDDIE